MPGDLNDLRALIRDHEEKDTGLTVDVELCLKTWLSDELAELEAEKGRTASEYAGSMASPDTAELDAEIEAKQAEIAAATIVLHFRALTEPRYREVLRNHPKLGDDDAEDGVEAAFLTELSEKCYRGVKHGGQEFTADDLPLGELRKSLTFGEFDPIGLEVYAINRQDKSRRPKSSKPSRTSRRT